MNSDIDYNFYILKLPKIPNSIKEHIRLLVKDAQIDEKYRIIGKKYYNEFNYIDRIRIANDTLLSSYINNNFTPILGRELISLILCTKNYRDTPACFPVHTDEDRKVALSYVIDAGGSDVCTVLYDRKNLDKEHSDAIRYNKVEPVISKQLEVDTWYLWNPRVYHSVEKIEGTRVKIELVFKNNNISYRDYLEEIKFLIQR